MNLRCMLAIHGTIVFLLTGCLGSLEKAQSISSLPDHVPRHAAYYAEEFTAPPAYFESGRLKASFGENAPVTYCNYTVEREGEGTAVVTITRASQATRTVFFSKGKATRVELDGGETPTFQSTRQGSMNVIRIDDERYAIPDLVIHGAS